MKTIQLINEQEMLDFIKVELAARKYSPATLVTVADALFVYKDFKVHNQEAKLFTMEELDRL